MSKSTFFTGQPVFSQLLKLIPSDIVRSLTHKHQSDHYYKSFKTYDHLVTMLYAAFFQCTSLREVTTGLQANAARLSHLGLRSTPRRSTLSDANAKRTPKLFESLFHELSRVHFSPDSRCRFKGEGKRIFLIDSTTISLFSEVMKGAGTPAASGKKKGGVKAHMMVDATHDIPSFIHITEAKENDLVFLKEVIVPTGAVVVFDKGYNNYHQFEQWTRQSVKWVTRLKCGSAITVTNQRSLSQDQLDLHIVTDQNVRLGRHSNKNQTPVIHARLIEFYDDQKNRTFHFITNDFESEPYYITQLYKQRWQIELLFKRIKQRYPLRYFLGETANAITIQIWSALICDLLVKVVQQSVMRLNKRWSYANLAAMIKHHLMTYIDLIPFLIHPEKSLRNYHPPDLQLHFHF